MQFYGVYISLVLSKVDDTAALLVGWELRGNK
jgi:hypothetical protein